MNSLRRGGGGSRGYNRNYQPSRSVQFHPVARRGVHFKRKSFPSNTRRAQPAVRSLLEEDIDMGGNMVTNTIRRGGANRSRIPFRRGHVRSHSTGTIRRFRKNPLPDSEWYECVVYHAQKYSKETIMNTICDFISMNFEPCDYKNHEQSHCAFHVKDKDVANEIYQASGQMQYPSGYKMSVSVKPSRGPVSPVTPDVVQTLTVVMSNRYKPELQSLDLSQLHDDKSLIQQNVFLSLSRSIVADKVLGIIGEHIPEMVALNISQNNLPGLGALAKLVEKAPNLKYIDVSDNNLRNAEELRHFAKLELTELRLVGNPFCTKLDKSGYISAVRRKFPKLLKLDDEELPPPVTFELDEPTVLPPIRGNYFAGSGQAEQVLGFFLEQYLSVFDSPDRQPLIDAYHESSVFSVSVGFNRMSNSVKHSFGDLLPNSRNLRQVKDRARRQGMLKTGPQDIVEFLKKLPATTHSHETLKVDILHIGETVMVFRMNGLLQEKAKARDSLRVFQRTMITVPRPGGVGLLITNDEMYITNPTQPQIRATRSQNQTLSSPVQIPAAGASSAPASLVNSPVGSPVPDDNIKGEMVRQFAEQSTMNQHFARICLEENSWNYEEAAKAFLAAKESGRVPPDAFKK